MQLSDLSRGAKARITHIDADQSASQRIMALGLLPSQLVQVVQLAPLGDPITVESNGIRISLRRADASSVQVETI